MSRQETIGLVGAAGDLGGKLAVQVCGVYDRVFTFDTTHAVDSFRAKTGIDPAIKPTEVAGRPVAVPTITGILESCSIVHWCAPLEAVGDIAALPVGSTLVLHDSVMNNSVVVAERLSERPGVLGKIAVVHCLMNPERRVVVASDTDATTQAYEHMAAIGLRPLEMKATEHDSVMAHSQAIFALLDSALNGRLIDYDERGLLTPSAQQLKKALDDRSSAWTETTIATILSNPELPKLIDALGAFVTKNRMT